MRKLPIIALIFLIAVGCSRRNITENSTDEAMRPEASTQETGQTAGDIRAREGKPWANFIGRYDEVFNDSNYLQYQHAEKLGIDPAYTLYDTYNTRRPLVKIESGKNYQLDELTHSMPYLVPEAARLLDEIGEEFSNTLDQRGGDSQYNKIIVTSVLRTPYTVKKLRRVNRNAVDSSTHMFGTTFDIAWNHFHYPDSSRSEDPVVLKSILAEVLLKKRNEGKCLVKFEKKTPCFHVTVSK